MKEPFPVLVKDLNHLVEAGLVHRAERVLVHAITDERFFENLASITTLHHVNPKHPVLKIPIVLGQKARAIEFLDPLPRGLPYHTVGRRGRTSLEPEWL